MLLLRPHVETLFGGGGGGGGGGAGGGGGGYYLTGRRGLSRRDLRGGGGGGGGGPQFGAGLDAAEASALGVGPPGPSGGAHHHRGASMASSIGGGGWTLDASPEILLEAGRYAGPWGGVDDADLNADVHLTHGSHGGFSSSHAMATMEPSFSFATPISREETPTPSYGRRAETRSGIGPGGGDGDGEGGDGEGGDEEGEAAASRPLLTRVVGDYESESDDE